MVDSITVVTTSASGSNAEDAATPTLTTNGSIEFTNSDPSPGVFHVTSATHTGSTDPQGTRSQLGTLSVNIFNDAAGDPDGAGPLGPDNGFVDWIYNVSNAAVQYLGVGDTLIETFDVLILAWDGEEQHITVTVTITGTNDGPAITSGAGSASFGEDSAATLASTGSFTFNDVDVTDVHAATVSVAATGDTAGLGLNNAALAALLSTTVNSTTSAANGSVAWAFGSNSSAFQYLKDGETLTLTYTVTVSDGEGGTADTTVTVTITGSDDNPTITAASSASGVVEAGLAGAGTATVSGDASLGGANWIDLDHGDDASLYVSDATGDGSTSPDGDGGFIVVGTYGTLTINADGTYSYTLDNGRATTQALAAGEAVSEVFGYSVSSTDPSEAAATSTITINITGSNDGPVIQPGGVTIGATVEAAGTGTTAVNHSGSFIVTDVDATDALSVSAGTSAVVWSAGTVDSGLAATLAAAFTVSDTDGSTTDNQVIASWSFNPGAVDLNFLAVGETLTITTPVTVADGNGGSVVQNVVITLTGTNDQPDISVVAGNGDSDSATLTETNAGLTASDTLTVADLDLTDSVTASVTGLSATGDTGGISNVTLQAMLSLTAGDLTGANGTGSLTWTFDSATEAFNHLDAGDVLTLAYTVEVSDGQGGIDTQTVTVTINGTNDGPFLAASTGIAPAAYVDPNGNGSFNFATDTRSGTLTFDDLDLDDIIELSDPDNSNTLTVADIHAIRQAATFTWFSGSTIVYSTSGFTNGSGGQPYSSSGTFPDSDPSLLGARGNILNAFQIDGAVFDAATNELLVNWSFDGTPGTGSAAISVDTNTSGALPTTIGTIDADFLGAGESLVVNFPVTVTDANGGSVTTIIPITFNGVNDRPTLATGAATGSTTEDGTLTATGTKAFSDADTTDLLSFSTGYVSATSTSPSGVSAALLAALQASAAFTVVPTYTAGDNDGSAEWTFNLDNAAAQYLRAGDTVTVTYRITLTDDSGVTTGAASTLNTITRDVTITITGTNDGPIAVADADSVVEAGLTPAGTPFAGTSTATGNVLTNDTDVDDGDTKVVAGVAVGNVAGPIAGNVATTLTGTYGTINISSTGGYTYTLDNGDAETQALAVGESATDVFSYTVVDGSGATSTTTVAITVNGTNDGPVVAVADASGAATEDATTPDLTDTGTITFDDIDLTDAHTTSVVAAGGNTLGGTLVASITDTATGAGDGIVTWTYTLANAAAQYLAAGQTATESFTITVADGNGGTFAETVIVTVTGMNDGPIIVVGGTLTGSESEAAGSATTDINESGSFRLVDVDLADTLTVTEGATTVVWSAGTIPPAIEAVLTAPGAFTFADSDSDANEVTVDWVLAASALDLNFLGAGETLTVTIPVTVSDGALSAIQNVVVTITGTNDVPVITNGGDSASISEIAGLTGVGDSSPNTVSGTFDVTDLDANGGIALTSSFQGYTTNYGPRTGLNPGQEAALAAALTFTPVVGNDGTVTWTYDISNADIDFLVESEVLTATLLVTADDGNGGTATTTVTVTINGRNDQVLLVSADTTGTWVEGSPAAPAITGAISFTDADFQNHGFQILNLGTGTLAGAGGTLTAALTNSALTDGTGTVTWSYSAGANVGDYLAVGESATEVFRVRILDPGGSALDTIVTVTITGTNDAPVMAGTASPLSFTEDSASLSANGNFTFDDVDVTDAHSVSVSVVASGNGNNAGLTLNNAQLAALLSATIADPATGAGDGTIDWAFAATNPAFQYLQAGQTLTLTYTVAVDDGEGGTDSESVTVNITGSNDAPVISAVNFDTPLGAGQVIVASGDPYTAVANAYVIGNNWSLAFNPDIANSTTVPHISFIVTGDANSEYFTFVTPNYNYAGPTNFLAFDVDSPSGTDPLLQWYFNGVLQSGIFDNFSVTAPYDGLPGNPLDPLLLANGNGNGLVVTVRIGSAASGGTAGIGLGNSYILHVSNPAFTGPFLTGDALTESNATLSTSGNVVFSDVDFVDAPVAAYDSATGLSASVAGGPALTAPQLAALASAFSITSGGAFTFSTPSPDYLGAGSVVTLNYTVTVSDGNGGTDTEVVTLTITGTNDAPTISLEEGDSAAASLAEGDAALSANGTLTVTDLDIHDTDSAAVTSLTVSGNNGGITNAALLAMFSITTGDLIANPGTTGSLAWNFASTPEAFNFLTATDTLTLTYAVQVTDLSGAIATRNVVVTIQGSNDVPTIAANTDAGSLVEDDLGLTTVSGDASNGGANWTDLDTGQDAALAITAGGTNGPEQIGLVFDGSAPGALANEARIVGTYGSLYLQANGQYRYVRDDADVDTQGLDGDQSGDDVFHYTISDASGGTATATILVTIDGEEDAAAIVTVNRATVTESDTTALVSFSVADQVAITDADVQDAANAQDYIAGSGSISTASALTPPAGALLDLVSFNAATGAISYDRNAFNWLQQGQSVTFEVDFDAQSGDDGLAAQSFTFTIDGQNDAPVAVDDTATVAENASSTFDILTNDTDADSGDTRSLASLTLQSVTGLGALTTGELADIADDFSISLNTLQFTPGAGLPGAERPYDRLNPGETATIVIEYTVADGFGGTDTGTFTLTLTGAAENFVGTPLDDNPFLGSSYDDTMSGLAGDDNISGNGGDDTLDGGVDDDVLSGGSGDDILIGGLGDDILSGGSDTDTAVFANNWAAYTITTGPTPGSYLLYGPGGEIDEISSVELVTFNGSGPFAVGTILNDAPTLPGSTNIIDENLAVGTLAAIAVGSDVDAVLGDVLSYSIVGGNTGGMFTINAANGEIRLAGSPDREALSTYSLTVRVTDVHGASADATVVVNINDLNDNAPVFTSGTTASVNENAPTSTVVYDANATDADSVGGPITFSLGGVDAALFNIDSATGEVRLNASADYEADTSYTIDVIANDGANTTTRTVTVSVNDLNDNAPVFTSGVTASINENAAVATVVYDASATDADTVGGPIVFSLGGTDAALFNINSATGEVRLNASADYEADASYTINVTANDGANTTTRTVTVSVNDLNDNAPVFTSGTTASINENAAATTVVYDANATDVDSVGGPITFSLGGADAALFNIDSATGEVRLNASADYEADASYTIDVIASDGANSTTRTVTVSVNDLNDNAPVFTSGTTASVNENAPTSTVIYDANATDVDSVGGPIAFTLGGVDAALFNIDAATGEVRLNASADYEADASYTIDVIANDGVNSTTRTVTVSVNDLNDNNPVFTSGTTANVNENVVAGTLVYTAAATDADATFGPVSYSLGGADAAAFAINASTGEVTLVGSPDREAQASYAITVTATQDITATTQAVTIAVNDLNDTAPVFTSGTTANVNENVVAGTLVYTAAATDADATFGPVSYSLGGADAAAFAIDVATGEVTLVGSPDREAQASYAITVTATQGITATTQAVTIAVNDLNDTAPVFTSGMTASIDENAAITTVVYDASVTDADTVGGPIAFSLGGADAALFNIDAATGEVRLNASADYEADASYTINVIANDGVNSTTRTVTVSVNDLNDNNPVFTSGTTANVNENVAAGTLVYTAAATDADATFGPVSYSLGGADAAAFAIDVATGEVTLVGSPDREAQASYAITVTATQGITATTQAVTVAVNDLNDTAPVFTSGTTASIDENSAITTVVYDAGVTDADTVGGPIAFSLGGADAALFNIDAATGEVRLNASADYEADASYTINVIANDGVNSTTRTVSVAVNDLNDNAPVFTSATTANINENPLPLALVYDANVTDADSVGGPITFSLGGPDASLFFIDSTTGQVRVLAAVNYEADASYTFDVIANDGVNSTTQTVTVSVNDVNEFAVGPVTIIGGAANEISSTGQTVGSASAIDGDGTATVSYSLVNNAGGRFAINATTGVITVANGLLLDFEQNASHQVTVRATSSDGSFSDGTTTITVNNVDPEVVNGTGAAETIVGGELFDTITLNGGNDTANGRGGIDVIDGGDGDDVLLGGDGDDSLEGGLGSDYLIGGDGLDLLSGGTGMANTLQGGTGDDIYIVGTTGDSTLEFAGEGTDEVRTVLNVHTLQNNVEILRYTGGLNFLGIGNSLANMIYGGVASDDLYGRDGNDELHGGTGVANTLLGGLGDDIYFVDAIGDSTVEMAGEGTDEIRTALYSHTLQNNVENLTFTTNAVHLGVGNDLGNVIAGGTGVDDLFGRAGNDTLRGGTGSANTMLGQEGDDLYVVEAAGDTVIEFAGEGTDTVQTALGSFTLRDNVENLTYTGSGAFTGIGSADGNIMRAGSGADFLDGRDGNDTLIGGSGADLLIGGAGADLFAYEGGETGADRILGFVSGTDRIGLSAANFAHSATFNLVQGVGPQTATNGNSTFFYNQATGELSYDADGNGAGVAVILAYLDPNLTLTIGDFTFY